MLQLTAPRVHAAMGTSHIFAWWSGLTIGDARRGVEIAGSALRMKDIDGQTYGVPDGPLEPAARTPSAHLLPNYEEHFIGYRDRSAIADALRTAKANSRSSARRAHIMVIDGQLVGGWKRTFQGKAGIVERDPVLRLSAPERRLMASAVERFGAFLERPVELAAARRETTLSSFRDRASRP